MKVVKKNYITIITLVVIVAIVLLIGGKNFIKGAVTVDVSTPVFELEMNQDISTSGQKGVLRNRGTHATAEYLGKRGGAWVFDGNKDYVITDSTHLKSLEEFTIMFWFKPEDLNLRRRGNMLWQGAEGGDGWGPQQELHISLGDETGWKTFEDHVLTFYFGDEKNNLKIKTPIKQIKWQHVAVTVRNLDDGAIAKLYHDGAYIGKVTSPRKIDQSKWEEATLLLGTASGEGPAGIDANRYFQGQMDELAIYGEVLEQPDIYNICWGQNDGVVCS